MEKKRVKLLELFNVDSDKYKDLDELYVVKVDIYKAKASINIILEGIDSLKYNNSVVALVSELEKDFDFKPSTTIEEGLSKFAEWYKEYYNI